MSDTVHTLTYHGTSRLLSRIILLCNSRLGWPIRTSHAELGTFYAEYRAHGATITLYGSLLSSKSDDLDIHLRIHEFTADMSNVIASLSDQIEKIRNDPDVKDNRYIIFEEKPNATVPKIREVAPEDNCLD